jgi:hypothetical protein
MARTIDWTDRTVDRSVATRTKSRRIDMDHPDGLRVASMRLDELEPSHLWVLGMAVDRPARPARRETAALPAWTADRPARRATDRPAQRTADLPGWAAECVCPDWCPRDHENE